MIFSSLENYSDCRNINITEANKEIFGTEKIGNVILPITQVEVEGWIIRFKSFESVGCKFFFSILKNSEGESMEL